MQFGVFDCSDGILTGATNMLENIFFPAICASENWGSLSQSNNGDRGKKTFKEIIRRYLTFLKGKTF